MAFINDNFKTATIALSNFAANGALGTAATTVDITSTFVITQTTAGISLTLPTPTDATAGDRLVVINGTASTTGITVAGVPLAIGEQAIFTWSGTAWITNDGGRNMGTSILVASIPVGNSLVTHNLALPTGTFSQVIFRAYNAAGNEVTFKRNKVADTTNAFGISSPVALTNITFDIIPLA